MKRRILPTKLMLPELPEEGREFLFDREGEELNPALKDIIGDNPYRIQFKIQPLGNVFQLKGDVEAQMDLQCSRCGNDFKFEMKEHVSEIIILDSSPMGRGDTTSRVNHTSDLAEQSQESTHLNSPVFNIGEFFHEIIALAEPIQPLGNGKCDPNCEKIIEEFNKRWQDPAEVKKDQEPGKHRPFAGLKDLKIN